MQRAIDSTEFVPFQPGPDEVGWGGVEANSGNRVHVSEAFSLAGFWSKAVACPSSGTLLIDDRPEDGLGFHALFCGHAARPRVYCPVLRQ